MGFWQERRALATPGVLELEHQHAVAMTLTNEMYERWLRGVSRREPYMQALEAERLALQELCERRGW